MIFKANLETIKRMFLSVDKIQLVAKYAPAINNSLTVIRNMVLLRHELCKSEIGVVLPRGTAAAMKTPAVLIVSKLENKTKYL